MLVELLHTIFAERTAKNPAYSLRSFARCLEIDSSTLSAILRRKRPASLKTARHLLDRLGVTESDEQRNYLLGSLVGVKSKSVPEYHEMALDQAEMISTWQHFVVLAALDLSNFRPTVKTLSQRLEIPFALTKECVERLATLGFVKIDETGLVKKIEKNYATPNQVPSEKLRQGHRQFMEMAVVAMDNVPIHRRSISGMTMAINSSRLKEAQERVQKFGRELTEFLEQGPRDSVYRLNLQLFPLDKTTS
jgi:uncharacterized protein (TIGR02147 family)